MPTLPESVQIGPYRYTIMYDQSLMEAEHSYGQIHYRDGRIILHPELAPDLMAEALLHEVLHGCVDVTGDGNEKGIEAFICRCSPLLLDCLRRNPDLVTFLLGG